MAPGEIPPSGDEERAKEPNASDDPKEAARAAFRALLAERGVAAKTRWDRIAPKISGDARFRAIATHAERRRVFERYLRDLDATGPGPGPGPGPGDDDADAAGSVQKRKRAAELEKAADAETRRAAKLAALERERSARAEAEASCAARRRLRNARERAADAFAALLAETARDAEEAWDDAAPRLAADPQRRGPSRDSVPPGGFGLADMRDAFEAHKAELRRRAATNCASLLAEALRCADASAFEEGSSDADADAGDGDASLRSFVAACSDERLTSDPRWEACSVAERAAQYVARIEALCGEVGAEMPREVAELRDELAAEREARRRGGEGRAEARARRRARSRGGENIYRVQRLRGEGEARDVAGARARGCSCGRSLVRRVKASRDAVVVARVGDSADLCAEGVELGGVVGVWGSASRVNPVELAGCFPAGHMTVLWLAAPRQRVDVARPTGGPAREGWRSPPQCPGIFAR